ncbi:unnamed protein product [Ilex paraguariensis]|uniref:Uncharacterized protein n=1 Tax=Ilex paraguariensis TaxID=185542 RepID=A0ABC8S0B0_9AQUA
MSEGDDREVVVIEGRESLDGALAWTEREGQATEVGAPIASKPTVLIGDTREKARPRAREEVPAGRAAEQVTVAIPTPGAKVAASWALGEDGAEATQLGKVSFVELLGEGDEIGQAGTAVESAGHPLGKPIRR